MKQIERISYFEEILAEGEEACRDLYAAVDRLKSLEGKIKELDKYFSSKERMEDIEADEAGLLPKDLKRGVLGEDYAWDLLNSYSELSEKIKDL